MLASGRRHFDDQKLLAVEIVAVLHFWLGVECMTARE